MPQQSHLEYALAITLTEPQDVTFQPLSLMLKEGTRAEHDEAETSHFISNLMQGKLSIPAYTDLAAQQYVIYCALEDAGEVIRHNTDEPRGASVVFDELRRREAIEADLEFLIGQNWREEIDILPATTKYAERLAETANWLGGYAAHAYTRYLGDLSGGQIIKRMLERHYGLGPEGISFYSFPEIAKTKPFKDLYRERLDALRFEGQEATDVVAEAQLAFRLNRALFTELGQRHSAAAE